jgi:subtilisin family serine protease
MTMGDSQVKVLVLDDGVQRDHPDLNVGGGADFTGQGVGGDPATACDGHGTAVAGCVAAVIDNGAGTVGIAPHCPVLGARVFATASECSGWWAQASWTVYGLAWGYIAGARVSNNSNGYGFWSNAIDAAYESTRRGGMVHFAASGNSGQQPLPYPANLPTVNAVAALHRNGQLAPFTNFGPDIDFCAPGTEILTTDRTGSQGWVAGDHVFASGTSFASPYAAGVAALLVAQNPARTAEQVELLLRQGCRDLGAPGFDPFYSWGFVNAYNSLTIGSGGQLADVGPDEERGGANGAGRSTPEHLGLEPGRPNPFAGRTMLGFALGATGIASLHVVDPRGRIVRRLVEGRLAAGPHGSAWDGRDDAGHRLPAGIYFARLRAAGRTATRKVALLRGTD